MRPMPKVKTPSEYAKRRRENAGTSEGIQHMRMVKTPTETLHTSMGNNAIRETIVHQPRESFCHYQYSDEDASSDDLTANVVDIKYPGGVKKEDEDEIRSLDLAAEGCNYVSVRVRGRQKRIQPKKKVSFAAISGNIVRKTICMTKN